MKSIILIMALFGIILFATGYVKSNLQCPPPRIEYRYIPKSFDDEQNTDVPLLSISGIYSMFENDSAWTQDTSYATFNRKDTAW
jgi:hypothetical protein